MDYKSIINRCVDTELADIVFNGLLRSDEIDENTLVKFKRDNYNEYNELVHIAKFLTNDIYHANNLPEIKEVKAWKYNDRYYETEKEAIHRRNSDGDIRTSDKFWIPKIGQTIYVIDNNKLNLRKVIKVEVYYSGLDRECKVTHEDSKTGDRDRDDVEYCFNKPEDCFSWLYD